MNSQPPLYLQPVVSRWLAAFILGSHAVTMLAVALLPGMALWGKLLLALAIVFSGWYYWRLHITRSFPYAVREMTFYQVDNCLLRTTDGSRFVRLEGNSFLHPWLCVLNLRSQTGKLYSLVLFPDSLPQDLWRQLRVRVKFGTADLP
ncbi:protein YgfX [Candidatus Thiothrix sp. Deng01]|uniref:Protein YgfX n=1 Tax=Candidatus Thiothrix phosphatis TaxID=3112415 RepID=A0ABU6D0K8_9GAMM|nr:protein YgfX [Candidatus Thiothrix sp. Deng01]MEB4592574.1 protein YgfX [Candidatus Thiothrix sp. Deng01]